MKRAQVVRLTLLVVLALRSCYCRSMAQPFAAGWVQVAAPLEAERLVGDAAVSSGPSGSLSRRHWQRDRRRPVDRLRGHGLYSVAPGQDGAIGERAAVATWVAFVSLAAGVRRSGRQPSSGFSVSRQGRFSVDCGAAGDNHPSGGRAGCPIRRCVLHCGRYRGHAGFSGQSRRPCMLWNFLDAAPSGPAADARSGQRQSALLVSPRPGAAGKWHEFQRGWRGIAGGGNRPLPVLRFMTWACGDLSVLPTDCQAFGRYLCWPLGNLWVSWRRRLAAPC